MYTTYTYYPYMYTNNTTYTLFRYLLKFYAFIFKIKIINVTKLVNESIKNNSHTRACIQIIKLNFSLFMFFLKKAR